MLRVPFVPMLIVAIAVSAAGCRKDDGAPATGGGTPLPSHLLLRVDSACVQAPNVFTPDGDGVNDRFFVFARNIATIEWKVRNPAGGIVATYHDIASSWDGQDPTGTGPYAVQVQALTTSGITLGGQATLTRLSYDGVPCLTYTGTPVTGDQFDPRLCGPVYATNEAFCP